MYTLHISFKTFVIIDSAEETNQKNKNNFFVFIS